MMGDLHALRLQADVDGMIARDSTWSRAILDTLHLGCGKVN